MLLGAWSGAGRGQYPTIDPFSYEETVEFSHVGKPVLSYRQRSTHATDGHPLHGEAGFIRMVGSDGVELVIAHPNGIVEVSEGTLERSTILLSSTFIGRTKTAKQVSMIERDLMIDGDTLRYSLRMSAVGQPMSTHLDAELRRIR